MTGKVISHSLLNVIIEFYLNSDIIVNIPDRLGCYIADCLIGGGTSYFYPLKMVIDDLLIPKNIV